MNMKEFYGRGAFAKRTLKICSTVFAIAWLLCLLIARDIVVSAIVSVALTLVPLIFLIVMQKAKEKFLNAAINLHVFMDRNESRYNREP